MVHRPGVLQVQRLALALDLVRGNGGLDDTVCIDLAVRVAGGAGELVRIDFVGIDDAVAVGIHLADEVGARSEEHTSELQSLMRISYAVFCLEKKKNKYTT